jgi:hypothetical protein
LTAINAGSFRLAHSSDAAVFAKYIAVDVRSGPRPTAIHAVADASVDSKGSKELIRKNL